ncbi:hypothetical protein CPR19088_GLDEOEPO_00385 [Companilactobacillus paralimentarius]
MIADILLYIAFVFLPIITFIYAIFSVINSYFKESQIIKLKHENKKIEIRVLNKLVNKQ